MTPAPGHPYQGHLENENQEGRCWADGWGCDKSERVNHRDPATVLWRERTQEPGQGAGRLTGGLGFRGEMAWFLRPGCGVGSHAPVTPRPNLVVLGCHLDDVLLPSIGIRDGVCCAIRQLHLQGQSRDGVRRDTLGVTGEVTSKGSKDAS